MTRSKRSMMIIVILLLLFSNGGTNCYASRPLSTMSNGVHVAGGNGNNGFRVVKASYITFTPPPGQTRDHYLNLQPYIGRTPHPPGKKTLFPHPYIGITPPPRGN